MIFFLVEGSCPGQPNVGSSLKCVLVVVDGKEQTQTIIIIRITITVIITIIVKVVIMI